MVWLANIVNCVDGCIVDVKIEELYCVKLCLGSVSCTLSVNTVSAAELGLDWLPGWAGRPEDRG